MACMLFISISAIGLSIDFGSVQDDGIPTLPSPLVGDSKSCFSLGVIHGDVGIVGRAREGSEV
jgi:hypothetical protein